MKLPINILVTHFPPSYRYLNPEYEKIKGSYIRNGVMASNCEEIIEKGYFDLFVFGHTHDTLVSKEINREAQSYFVSNGKGSIKDKYPNSDFIHDQIMDLRVFLNIQK